MVLFLRSKKGFCYIPENESEQDILGWNKSDAEGGLAFNNEYNDIPVMATVLDREFPMPEVTDNYMNASVLFSRGDAYVRGKVIGQKRYSYGNDIGRSNNNPIIDTYKYCVDFDDEDVRKLTKNVIT